MVCFVGGFAHPFGGSSQRVESIFMISTYSCGSLGRISFWTDTQSIVLWGLRDGDF